MQEKLGSVVTGVSKGGQNGDGAVAVSAGGTASFKKKQRMGRANASREKLNFSHFIFTLKKKCKNKKEDRTPNQSRLEPHT